MRVFTASESFGNSRVKLGRKYLSWTYVSMFLSALWLCHFNFLNTTSSLRKQASLRTQIWVVLLIGRAASKLVSTNQKHYPDLVSASDWSCRLRNLLQPIRSTTQIWLVLLIGRAACEACFNQSEALPRSGHERTQRLFTGSTIPRRDVFSKGS